MQTQAHLVLQAVVFNCLANPIEKKNVQNVLTCVKYGPIIIKPAYSRHGYTRILK